MPLSRGLTGETPLSYIDKILQPGETVRHTAYIHWLIYMPAFVFGTAALAAILLVTWNIGDIGTTWREAALIGAAVLGLIGFYKLLQAWVTRNTTELVVTDRRVVYKRGLIRRFTAEMNMERIESVLVDQSILGRVFNYGTVTVRGTGGGMDELPDIEDPLTFRNHVTAQ
jgi:uncharacterized membrane protein YdbT with pleckstrin-like domain